MELTKARTAVHLPCCGDTHLIAPIRNDAGELYVRLTPETEYPPRGFSESEKGYSIVKCVKCGRKYVVETLYDDSGSRIETLYLNGEGNSGGKDKEKQLLEVFCSGKRLAQDVCWAMAIAPSCSDVMVTKAFSLGWHISCVAGDLGRRQVELILGDNKSARVNWL